MLSKPTDSNQPASDKCMVTYLSEPSAYPVMAKTWYEIAASNHFWFKWRFNIVGNLLPNTFKWGTILDIGCGNGILGRQIQSLYAVTASGCDLDQDQLRSITYGYKQLYYYDIHQREARFENHFSTILLMDVLEHIEEPERFLSSVYFHLSPTGRLIINVPALQIFYSKYDTLVGHLRRYDINFLRQELELAGFEIENAGYWGMTLIPLLLIRKYILYFTLDEAAIKMGFQPLSPFIGQLLDYLRKLETTLFTRTPIGSSLMIIAKKHVQAPEQ